MHHENRNRFKDPSSDLKYRSAQSLMPFLEHLKGIGQSLKLIQSALKMAKVCAKFRHRAVFLAAKASGDPNSNKDNR